MHHNKKGRKLSRRPDHRRAMVRNLALSLIEHERIQTTVPRAKELRGFAERLVTYAKKGDLASRRLIIRKLGQQTTVTAAAAEKLIADIAPRYNERQGGYTRVLKTGFRRGDSAPTALIEWVEEELPPKRTKQKPEPAKPAAKAEPEPEEESAADEPAAEAEATEEATEEAAAEAEATEEAPAEDESAGEAAEAEEAPAEEEPKAEAEESSGEGEAPAGDEDDENK